MKTTIEIPDSTLRRAKSIAGSRGISLKQLFTEALEAKLRTKATAGPSSQPPWMKLAGAFGKTPSARAETRRIQKVIDEEFELVEPEDQV